MEMKLTNVKLISSNIPAVFKSDEMQAALLDGVQDIASKANSQYQSGLRGKSRSGLKGFEAKTRVLRNTAVGVVRAQDRAASNVARHHPEIFS